MLNYLMKNRKIATVLLAKELLDFNLNRFIILDFSIIASGIFFIGLTSIKCQLTAKAKRIHYDSNF